MSNHDDYFQSIQKACLPGVWSKGVALAREGAVTLDARDGDEIRIRVKISNKPVSPRVTLWPDDEDWYCDCGDRNELCMHIAAAVVALKNGQVQSGQHKEGQESSSTDGIEYRFQRQEGALNLERWIVKGSQRERLSGSLVGFVGGLARDELHLRPFQPPARIS